MKQRPRMALFFKKVVEYLMVEVGWVPESPSRPKSKAGINAKFQSILFVKMENVNRMIFFVKTQTFYTLI